MLLVLLSLLFIIIIIIIISFIFYLFFLNNLFINILSHKLTFYIYQNHLSHLFRQYSANDGLMEVKLGANNRNSTEQTQRIAKVETVHSHTDHEYFIKNDIALIQLESPVEYTDYIQPVCLPEKSEDLPLYSTCYTVGWGKTKWDGKLTQMHLLR